MALCRVAGLPARYVHGNCKFSSGKRYGHVWAQVYINNNWHNADAISSINSFGVIENWDTGSATIYGYYRELSF
ncbi:transglutaminase domain-containing protein [Methanobacterium sp. ACI-7]|uniref:transglutaminase domain-containing protein n=1 Tax=Methanobacterium sp. ACI-7 TaxID=3240853 RepID=UPI0039C17DB4